jgi:hypothetical protein
MRESYFPVITTGSYCVKCRKRILRERHRRRSHGIHPYRMIEPISTWKLFLLAGSFLAAFVISMLVLIEWYYK